MINNIIGKIVKENDSNLVGKVIDIHKKGLHYDDNLREDFYYLVFFPEIEKNLYVSENEITIINFKE